MRSIGGDRPALGHTGAATVGFVITQRWRVDCHDREEEEKEEEEREREDVEEPQSTGLLLLSAVVAS